MEKLDFIFVKSRGLGELIQDYLSLFRRIFRHFNSCIFKFILPFLAIFLLLFFFLSSWGVNIFYSDSVSRSAALGLPFLLAAFVLFFYLLFIPTFGLEYMFLLKEKESLDFSGQDVWSRVKHNLRHYIIFYLAAFVVMLILLIPLVIAAVILAFIPLIGGIALGILSACLAVVFSSALFLYLQGKEKVFDSFMAAWRLLKKKILVYGLTAYIFRVLLTICLGLLTIVPALIIGIIAYNSIGFNEHIFISFGGKILISLAGTLFILLVTMTSVYVMTFYTLIYFSSLEATHKEGTISQIEQIGMQDEEQQQ